MLLVYTIPNVAPVRERGLKLYVWGAFRRTSSRSREGAWIEIAAVGKYLTEAFVAPVRERGLKLPALAWCSLFAVSLP